MSAATAFKCPETGDVVRPSGGRCPTCGADRMRGHLRLVGREWVLDQEDDQGLSLVKNPTPVIEYAPSFKPRRQFVTPDLLRRYRTARAWPRG